MVLPKGANIHPRAVCLGTLEPQLLQNALPKVLGGERIYSPLLFCPESFLGRIKEVNIFFHPLTPLVMHFVIIVGLEFQDKRHVGGG